MKERLPDSPQEPTDEALLDAIEQDASTVPFSAAQLGRSALEGGKAMDTPSLEAVQEHEPTKQSESHGRPILADAARVWSPANGRSFLILPGSTPIIPGPGSKPLEEWQPDKKQRKKS
jgi:hypothetical protein